ncbi:MAG: hypothetical protein Q8S33_10500 [Myxococcales bacterium]|nr:hypothetical protein [Myxococcales bacterium]
MSTVHGSRLTVGDDRVGSVDRWQRALTWLPLVVFGCWASTRFFRHVDISDANLYRVIARHLAVDGGWTDLRYLPTAYPRFFEHLPFGFWPMALVIRVVSESALPALQLGLSALTVWLVGRSAKSLAGPGAAVLAMTTLALTQNFFFLASLTLLDVPLLLGAALVMAGLTRPKPDALLVTLTFAGTLVGVAAKGPFGLMTPGALWLARVLVDRSFTLAMRAGLAITLAVVPVAGFVALSPDWLEAYGRGQVLASLTGARSDGDGARFFTVGKVFEMFWPGLALIACILPGLKRRLVGESSALHRRALWVAGLAVVILLVGLSLPARKVAHHAFVSFPLMALLSGVVLGPALERLIARRSARPVALVLAALGVFGLVAGPLGVARLFSGPPCVMSTELAPAFDVLAPGTSLEVVATDSPWPILSALSAERRLVPVHVRALGETALEWALVEEALWPAAGGFTEVGRARGWVLAKRR